MSYRTSRASLSYTPPPSLKSSKSKSSSSSRSSSSNTSRYAEIHPYMSPAKIERERQRLLSQLKELTDVAKGMNIDAGVTLRQRYGAPPKVFVSGRSQKPKSSTAKTSRANRTRKPQSRRSVTIRTKPKGKK